MRDFSRNLGFARRNGYKGTYAEYEQIQYKGYCDTCKRCEIKPLSKTDWLAA